MNKKITLYELLGLVKDGKAPKKVLYCDYYYYDDDFKDYVRPKTNHFESDYYLFMNCFGVNIGEALNYEVEILDDEDKNSFTGWKMYQDGKEVCSMDCSVEEKKIPEKLEIYKDRNNNVFLNDLCYKYMPIHKDSLSFNEQVIVDKLNEVLDYLKSKGE